MRGNNFFQCALIFVLTMFIIRSAHAQSTDSRNILAGNSIYENSYIDQPYVVILKDGSWFCVFTTGSESESRPGQHIVAIRSADHGLTWSKPVSIEPNIGPISSWAIPYLTSYGRIYVFYNYNGDNIAELKGKPIRQAGLLGWYCYKYSDDNGQTWSTERYRLPVKKTSIDFNNDFNGKVQLLWGIDKPILVKDNLFFAFTKLGKFPQGLGEGWFFKSDNIDTEKKPDKIHWEMLPAGDSGLRNPDFGSVQEEFNVVTLKNSDLFCMYRTAMGFSAGSYSRDGGKTWSMPEAATYVPGGKQVMKNPRACPRVFKCANGKYLFWYHNHGGKDFKNRNPVWISGGIEKNGFIYWSQPEILLYDNDLTVNGMSYPDLIEEGGKYWITETQKVKARVHPLNTDLLKGVWNQESAKTVVKKGLIVNIHNIKRNKTISLPALPSLKEGGFAIELWIKFTDLKPGQTILDSRNAKGKGIYITTTDKQTLRLEMSDGIIAPQSWDSDPDLLQTDKLHHIVFIADGAPDIITVVVDGKLCDGGNTRQFGWGRFSEKLEDINGNKKLTLSSGLHGSLKNLRIYNRYLTTSEAISNFHAGVKR